MIGGARSGPQVVGLVAAKQSTGVGRTRDRLRIAWRSWEAARLLRFSGASGQAAIQMHPHELGEAADIREVVRVRVAQLADARDVDEHRIQDLVVRPSSAVSRASASATRRAIDAEEGSWAAPPPACPALGCGVEWSLRPRPEAGAGLPSSWRPPPRRAGVAPVGVVAVLVAVGVDSGQFAGVRDDARKLECAGQRPVRDFGGPLRT